MIIQNGTIEVKRKAGGGINLETGYPNKPAAVAWDSPIPCQYSVNKYSNLGRVNGEHFTTATYTVLIEEQPFTAEQIRLKNLAGKVIGEFSVIQVEPLNAVCELRILI
jgi:hypothetical protein|nr:MAG TPA: hypothetical protein [Caudoviricetes sp.]